MLSSLSILIGEDDDPSSKGLAKLAPDSSHSSSGIFMISLATFSSWSRRMRSSVALRISISPCTRSFNSRSSLTTSSGLKETTAGAVGMVRTASFRGAWVEEEGWTAREAVRASRSWRWKASSLSDSRVSAAMKWRRWLESVMETSSSGAGVLGESSSFSGTF